MKLKRLLMPVVVLGIMFGMVGAAEAGITCSVSSAPVSRATVTGHTEVAGDLTLLCSGTPGAVSSATLTVDLGGVIISNSQTYPGVGTGIRIEGFTGNFTIGNTTIAAVNNTTGQIIISLPATVGDPILGTNVSSFTLRGVLLSLADQGKATLDATISISPGTNYFITAGEQSAKIITTILQGLGNPCLGSTTTTTVSGGIVTCSSPAGTVPATALTSGSTISTAATTWALSIPENYIDMLRRQTQITGTAPTNGVQIDVTVSALPIGVTLGNCTLSSTSGTPQWSPGTATTSFSSTLSTTVTRTIIFTTDVSPTALDVVTVQCTDITVAASAIPLAAGTITATVTLSPTGTALCTIANVANQVCTGSTSTNNGAIPRYKSSPSSAITIVNIVPATTTFLVPFVVTNSTFDTGLAISNTTADPFGTANGGARAQSGTITFTFFPVTGSSFSYTTSATSPTGNGGLSSGQLASGKTWTVLATELLTAAGYATPRAFSGYIIAVANFTNGHGNAFVSDFKGFTSATDVLVMAPPALVNRNISNLNNYVESLAK